MHRFVLTDVQWAKMEPLCLGKATDPGRTGGDNRLFLEAVLWIARTGSPWRDLPPTFGKAQAQATPVYDASVVPVRVGTTVDEAERLLILRTLESTGQNKTRAAEILGVSLKTLHNKLKEYSQSREDQPA